MRHQYHRNCWGASPAACSSGRGLRYGRGSGSSAPPHPAKRLYNLGSFGGIRTSLPLPPQPKKEKMGWGGGGCGVPLHQPDMSQCEDRANPDKDRPSFCTQHPPIDRCAQAPRNGLRPPLGVLFNLPIRVPPKVRLLENRKAHVLILPWRPI